MFQLGYRTKRISSSRKAAERNDIISSVMGEMKTLIRTLLEEWTWTMTSQTLSSPSQSNQMNSRTPFPCQLFPSHPPSQMPPKRKESSVAESRGQTRGINQASRAIIKSQWRIFYLRRTNTRSLKLSTLPSSCQTKNAWETNSSSHPKTPKAAAVFAHPTNKVLQAAPTRWNPLIERQSRMRKLCKKR